MEGKNGAVVRKQIGYGAIGSEHAEGVQKFYTAHFNPYLNFTVPAATPRSRSVRAESAKRVYPAEDYRTPYEKLATLDRTGSSI